ncbi:20006_t:CDS:2, partial [Racocetra persica]
EQKLARLKSQLAQKQQQIQQQYNLQDLNLISTADLANSPAIHSFFTNLLTTYAEKFARSKGLNTSQLPLKFAGFYYEPEADRKLGTGQGLGIMGRHDKYFTSKPTYGEYYFIDISFKKMIETCSHEIAHYIQLVKHNKSSCESDLVINKENYDGELAREHE